MPINTTVQDPYHNFRFVVDIGGGRLAGGFTKASGLKESSDEILYREGNYAFGITHKKVPGIVKYDDVVLTRGASDNMDLVNWRRQVAGCDGSDVVKDGRSADYGYRTSVTVFLLERGDPATPGRRAKIWRAWPRGVEWSPLEGKGSDILIESMTIAHEGIEWGQGGLNVRGLIAGAVTSAIYGGGRGVAQFGRGVFADIIR